MKANRTPEACTPAKNMMQDRANQNARVVVDAIMAHVAEHLSDIYKIERFELVKAPYIKATEANMDTLPDWFVHVEAEHSYDTSVRAVFSFPLTVAKIAEIVKTHRYRLPNRAGHYDED